jgi:hypothetical protein
MPRSAPPEWASQSPQLYKKVKREADERFKAPTSVYKSAWIVAQYKARGGVFPTQRPPSDTGLSRWFREEWVDVARAHGKSGALPPCGRTASEALPYPVCRPSKRVSQQTPRTVSEVEPDVLRRAAKEKQRVREKGRVSFSGKRGQ